MDEGMVVVVLAADENTSHDKCSLSDQQCCDLEEVRSDMPLSFHGLFGLNFFQRSSLLCVNDC